MESIGRKFKEAREAKDVTLSQAASATRIKFQHLESMEQGDFSKIAAAAYARGFIKIYAEYLELSPDPLIRLYMQQLTQDQDADGRDQTSVQESNRAAAAGGQKNSNEKTQTLSGISIDSGLIKRVVISAVIIVVAVLLLVSLSKLFSAKPDEKHVSPGSLSDSERTLLIKDPPDIYLEIQVLEENP